MQKLSVLEGLTVFNFIKHRHSDSSKKILIEGYVDGADFCLDLEVTVTFQDGTTQKLLGKDILRKSGWELIETENNKSVSITFAIKQE